MPAESSSAPRIVITGMGAITPLGNDVASLWRNLTAGIESRTEFSDEDLSAEGFPAAAMRDPKLVRSGFVRRAALPEDRRCVVVELTAKGEAFFRDFETVIRRRWEEVLLALDPHELQAFHEVITKLREGLQTAGD